MNPQTPVLPPRGTNVSAYVVAKVRVLTYSASPPPSTHGHRGSLPRRRGRVPGSGRWRSGPESTPHPKRLIGRFRSRRSGPSLRHKVLGGGVGWGTPGDGYRGCSRGWDQRYLAPRGQWGVSGPGVIDGVSPPVLDPSLGLSRSGRRESKTPDTPSQTRKPPTTPGLRWNSGARAVVWAVPCRRAPLGFSFALFSSSTEAWAAKGSWSSVVSVDPPWTSVH